MMELQCCIGGITRSTASNGFNLERCRHVQDNPLPVSSTAYVY